MEVGCGDASHLKTVFCSEALMLSSSGAFSPDPETKKFFLRDARKILIIYKIYYAYYAYLLCNYFCIEIILTSQVVKSKQRFTCPTGDRNLKNVLAVIQFIESRNCYKYIKDFYCNVAGI